jgi:hypothetical protein
VATFSRSVKRRTARTDEDVWVYRNLMRTDGVWYSLMQRGLVVAHAREVALADVRFVVRPGGHQRVLESGVKNVHAFAVGRLLRPSPASVGVAGASALRARYVPRRCDAFECELDGAWVPVHRAARARLGAGGLEVWGPDCGAADTGGA